MMKLARNHVMLVAICAFGLMLGCKPEPKTDPGKKPGNGGSAGAGGAADAVEVIIEAEAMTAAGLFTTVDDADASGGKAMQVPEKETCPQPQAEAPEGNLAFTIELKADAAVTVWCRVKWNDTCSNSFTVILPSGMKKTVTGSTLKKWFWIPAAKGVELKAGTHSFTLAAREYGAFIDQILVTDDDARVPRGVATNFKEMAKE